MQQQQHASSCSAGRRSGGARDRNPHRRKEFDKTRRASESYMCKSQDYGYSAVQPVPGTYCTEYQYLRVSFCHFVICGVQVRIRTHTHSSSGTSVFASTTSRLVLGMPSPSSLCSAGRRRRRSQSRSSGREATYSLLPYTSTQSLHMHTTAAALAALRALSALWIRLGGLIS